MLAKNLARPVATENDFGKVDLIRFEKLNKEEKGEN